MSKLLKSIKSERGYNSCYGFDKYLIYTLDHDPITQPHFYVVDSKTYGKKFCSIILINKPQYYKGETHKLNQKEISKMMIMFQTSYYDEQGMIRHGYRWEDIILSWNYKNKQKVRLTKQIPDYNKLI